MRANPFVFVVMFLLFLSGAATAADLALVPEACALVTNQDVQKIAEEELGEPEADKTTNSDGVKLSGCTYSSTDGSKMITMALRASQTGDNNPPVMIQAMKADDKEIEDVAGVGDLAIWKPPSNLQAFKGKDIQLIVNVINFANSKDKATAMAKLLFEKLAASGKAEKEN